MSTTTQSAERTALQGLLLLIVEVQNIVRSDNAHRIDPVEQLVESPHARELVQLARAALDNPLQSVTSVPPRSDAAEGPCNDPQPDKVIGVLCQRCCYTIREHKPRAIPAAAAGVHS